MTIKVANGHVENIIKTNAPKSVDQINWGKI
jgi:hypothetical protein